MRNLVRFSINLVELTTADLLCGLDAITRVRSVKVGPTHESS